MKLSVDIISLLYIPYILFHFLISTFQVEKKLKQTVTQWEEDHCRRFIVFDKPYLDELENQLANYNLMKEQEKMKKVCICKR